MNQGEHTYHKKAKLKCCKGGSRGVKISLLQLLWFFFNSFWYLSLIIYYLIDALVHQFVFLFLCLRLFFSVLPLFLLISISVLVYNPFDSSFPAFVSISVTLSNSLSMFSLNYVSVFLKLFFCLFSLVTSISLCNTVSILDLLLLSTSLFLIICFFIN